MPQERQHVWHGRYGSLADLSQANDRPVSLPVFTALQERAESIHRRSSVRSQNAQAQSSLEANIGFVVLKCPHQKRHALPADLTDDVFMVVEKKDTMTVGGPAEGLGENGPNAHLR